MFLETFTNFGILLTFPHVIFWQVLFGAIVLFGLAYVYMLWRAHYSYKCSLLALYVVSQYAAYIRDKATLDWQDGSLDDALAVQEVTSAAIDWIFDNMTYSYEEHYRRWWLLGAYSAIKPECMGLLKPWIDATKSAGFDFKAYEAMLDKADV